jgi:hypothetical protein
LRLADHRFLIGAVQSDESVDYVSAEGDVFEEVSVRLIDRGGRTLWHFESTCLFPAIVKRGQEMLFAAPLPEGLDLEKVSQVHVRFHRKNIRIMFEREAIPRVTSLKAPLPEGVGKGIGLMAEEAEGVLGARQVARIKVRILNQGRTRIPALGVFLTKDSLLREPLQRLGIAEAVAVGDHRLGLAARWRDRSGHEIAGPGPRTWLPRDIPPGRDVTVDMVFQTPREPGAYVLEVGMVQEPDRWLGNEGMDTLKLPVRVE